MGETSCSLANAFEYAEILEDNVLTGFQIVGGVYNAYYNHHHRRNGNKVNTVME
jgi:hypothetical protein